MNNTNQNLPAPSPAQTAALALRENLAAIPFSRETGVQIASIGNAFALSELVLKAGFAPKGSTAESLTLAMLEGASIGLNPLQAVQGISVVNGRPALWGDALVAVVKGSPVFGGERIEAIADERNPDRSGVRVTVWRKGDEENAHAEQFTIGDAKRAGLWGKPGPWTQYPRTMLRHRAVALAYRQTFADVLKGVRYAEEERDAAETPVAPATTAPAPIQPETPAPVAKKRASRLRAALNIEDAVASPAEPPAPPSPEPEPTFAPGGEPATAPETAPSAPQDAQEAPPPKFTEDLPFTA